jgi:dienelactone hydrolase
MRVGQILVRGLAAAGLLASCGAAVRADDAHLPSDPVGGGVRMELRRTKPTYSEYEVTFPSPVQTAVPANNTVHLKFFAPHGSVQAHSAVLHSLGVTQAQTERALCIYLAERGIAAALVALPYHLERRPAGTRPGSLLLDPDPERMADFLRQASADLDEAVTWLQGRPEIDARRIGIVGISLGALVGSLQMARDERLTVNVALLGGGDLAHILTHGALTVFARRAYRRKGLDEATLRRALAPVDPLTYARPLSPPRRMLMINGRYDVVIPRSDVLKLWRAFGEPPILWLDTGHYGPSLISDRLHAVIGDFLEAAFDNRPWREPGVPALTLRLGLMTGYAPVLSLAALLDLGRLARRPDLRIDAGLRSAGLMLSLDLGIKRGLDLVFGTYLFRGRPSPSAFLFWHVVL